MINPRKNPAIRNIFFLLLRLTGLPFILREIFQRNRVTIILYHDVEFKTAVKHFSMLTKLYNIISLRDFLESYTYKRLDKLNRKPLIITFDDGHKSNFELLPLFKNLKAPVTIFLCTGIIGTNKKFWWKTKSTLKPQSLFHVDDTERIEMLKRDGVDVGKEYQDRQALSFDEIEIMKKHVEFQAHSISHPILTQCDEQKKWKEISEPKVFIKEKFGIDVYSISYPNGDYDEKAIQLSQQSGYKCGITVDCGYNTQKTNLFKLKRLCIYDDGGINELIVMSSGLWIFLKKIFLRRISK